MSSERVRVTVVQAGLVIQPEANEVERFPPAGPTEMTRDLPPTADDRVEGRRRFEVLVGGWRFEATVEPAARADLRDRAARVAASHQHTTLTLRAQIPGRVVQVWVAEGETIEHNQRLLAIEAMKMENEIRAPHGGTVSGLRVQPGTLVERNDELLNIA